VLSSFLIVAIALAGVATCPASALSCATAKRMSDCCDKTSLASGDCCCQHSRGVSVNRGAAVAESIRAKHLLLPALGSHVLLPTVLGSQLGGLGGDLGDRGLSPPDTPIQRHVVLLL